MRGGFRLGHCPPASRGRSLSLPYNGCMETIAIIAAARQGLRQPWRRRVACGKRAKARTRRETRAKTGAATSRSWCSRPTSAWGAPSWQRATGGATFRNAQVEAGLYRNAAFVAAAFEALEARCCGQRRAGAFEDAGEGACEGAGGRTSCRGRVDRSRLWGQGRFWQRQARPLPRGAGMAAPDGAERSRIPLPGGSRARFLCDLGAHVARRGGGAALSAG